MDTHSELDILLLEYFKDLIQNLCKGYQAKL